MKFRLAAMTALAVAAVACPAAAGALTNTSVTLSTANVSTPTTVTIAYTTETAMGTGSNTNILIGAFPGLAFTTGNCTNGEITLSVDGAPVGGTFPICGLYGGNSIQVSLPTGVTVPAGANVVVTVPNSRASTGSTGGTYSATIITAQSSGAAVDTATPAPTYAFGAAPAAVPTMTEWAMMILAMLLAGGAAVILQRRRASLA
jgi:hypothetical protein